MKFKRKANDGVKKGKGKAILEPVAAEKKHGQRSMKAKAHKSMSQH